MIEKATKSILGIRLSNKEYICFMKLHKEVSENIIKSTIMNFVGEIYQMPPVKSAVKRKLRKRTIYYIDILEIKKRNVLMKIGCEAGTYIRKLCHDIGLALGTGANMQELVRSKVGFFEYKNSITLQALTDAYDKWKKSSDERKIRELILPMEFAFRNLPKIIVKDNTIKSLSNGSYLKVPGVISLDSNIEKDNIICIFSQKMELISLSKSLMTSKEISILNNGIVAIPLSLLIDPINQ